MNCQNCNQPIRKDLKSGVCRACATTCSCGERKDYRSEKCQACRKISDSALLADLRRLAKKLGHQPTITEYERHGKYYKDLFRIRFGGWREGIEAAGLRYKDQTRLPAVAREDLVADLKRVAAQLNRLPTPQDYKEHGRHAISTLYKLDPDHRWASLVVTLLGVDPDDARKAAARGGNYVTVKERLEQLRQIAVRLGYTPPIEEAQRAGFRYQALIPEFGSWAKVVEAAGLPPVKTKRPGVHATEADLIAEFRRVVQRIGRIPTAKEFDNESRFNQKTVAARLGNGTWKEATRFMFRQLAAVPLSVAPAKQMGEVSDPTREFLRDASQEAIAEFFKTK